MARAGMDQVAVQKVKYLDENDIRLQESHLETDSSSGKKSFLVTETNVSDNTGKTVIASALKRFTSETDLISVGFDYKKWLSILDEYLFWDVEEHFKQQFYLFNEQANKLPNMSFKQLQLTKCALLQEQLKEVQPVRIQFANEVRISLVKIKNKLPTVWLRGIEDEPQTSREKIVTHAAVEALKEKFEIDLESIKLATYNGVFTFQIRKINEELAKAKQDENRAVYSASFYTSEKEGYKFWMMVMLNGDSDEGIRGKYCSVFISLLPHIYDDAVEWPIKPVVTFSLLNQHNGESIIIKMNCQKHRTGFTKPIGSFNQWSMADCQWIGIKDFAEISKLSKPEFIQNNTLFLKCEINFPPNQVIEYI